MLIQLFKDFGLCEVGLGTKSDEIGEMQLVEGWQIFGSQPT